MIHIEKDQKILENENLRVYSKSGDYQDDELIEVYDVNNPEIISGAFAAQYIRYGGIVYKFNDPIELGKEILLLDPESTHSTASFIRMQNELLAQLNNKNLQPQSLQEVTESEQQVIEEKLSSETNLGTEEIKEKIEESKTNIDQLESESNTIETNIPLTEPTSTPTEIIQTPPEAIIEPQIEIPTPTTEITETETLDTLLPSEETIQEEPLSILTNKSGRKIS
ncbi:MAG: hypothetical protein RLZZ517_590 [Candidatus Parcubacteria bacterium]|jgi:hypothetical protein